MHIAPGDCQWESAAPGTGALLNGITRELSFLFSTRDRCPSSLLMFACPWGEDSWRKAQ